MSVKTTAIHDAKHFFEVEQTLKFATKAWNDADKAWFDLTARYGDKMAANPTYEEAFKATLRKLDNPPIKTGIRPSTLLVTGLVVGGVYLYYKDKKSKPTDTPKES